MAWIPCGLDQLWLGSNLTSLQPGGQVANAHGRCAPRTCKNVLQPSPLWLGFIMACIHCGLDQLWLGLNLMSHRPGGQVSNERGRCAPRTCKNLLQPSPLWLEFIVVWINCGLDPLWFGLDNELSMANP